MDANALRQSSSVERERLVAELRAKIQKLRRAAATRALSNVRELRETRAALARLLTVRNEAPTEKTS